MVMERTIREAAELTGISPSAIRFYDRKGLLVRTRRNESGYRVFDDSAIEELRIVDYLRHAGMPIQRIRQLAALAELDAVTMDVRYRLLASTRADIVKQLDYLQRALAFIDAFCARYERMPQAADSDFQAEDIDWMAGMLDDERMQDGCVKPKKDGIEPKK